MASAFVDINGKILAGFVTTSDAPQKNNTFFMATCEEDRLKNVDACIINQCFLPSIIGHQA